MWYWLILVVVVVVYVAAKLSLAKRDIENFTRDTDSPHAAEWHEKYGKCLDRRRPKI